MDEETKNMIGVKVVRMEDAGEHCHFYTALSINLFGPLLPGDNAGFIYIVRGRRYDNNDVDFMRAYATPEKAWEFYMDFEAKCQGSCWRFDCENRCFVDSDGIRFAISGRALP